MHRATSSNFEQLRATSSNFEQLREQLLVVSVVNRDCSSGLPHLCLPGHLVVSSSAVDAPMRGRSWRIEGKREEFLSKSVDSQLSSAF